MNNKVRLFISYCHDDAAHITSFNKHMTKFVDDNILDIWWDKNITAGYDFWEQIDFHIENRDIICLFISANYLASKACKEEMRRACELRTRNGICVVPIILSPCSWLDYDNLKPLLAIPTDGKAISSFPNPDDGWHDVYNHMKKVIKDFQNIKELHFSAPFSDFLGDATLLTKAHHNKRNVKLDDIFIYPELSFFDSEKDKQIKCLSEDLIKNFTEGDRLVIIGDDQSGKTSLLKKYITVLKEKNFIPVYIFDKEGGLQGNFDNRIAKTFKEEYNVTEELELYNQAKVVPIIDDFYKVNNKEKIIEILSRYKSCIVVVDDIYCLDIQNENILVGFKKYQIKEFKASLRNKLIQKWISLTEDTERNFVNGNYDKLDEKTELVEVALGKAVGGGIMPAYPFFILSLISTYDTFDKPLDQEITSQGYCYQALIYFFLRKYGVSNEDIDTYINFLTEFAYKIYQNRGELVDSEFNNFVTEYSNEYNLTQNKETIISILSKARIIRISSCRNYSFEYPYLYYFFAGKYFAEHTDENDSENAHAIVEIDNIVNNLHTNENAYIAIFISHHTKSKFIQNKVVDNARKLFKTFPSATLNKDELCFFASNSTNAKLLIESSITEENPNPDKVRQEMLEQQDQEEELNARETLPDELAENELAVELRRSIKTVEVIGHIIKNRAGSLKQTELITLFKEAMNVHLRLLSSFFDLIKNIVEQPNSLQFLAERVDASYKESGKNIAPEQLPKIAKTMFWNMNFMVILGILEKISFSLGSNRLTGIIKKVCDEIDSPATFIVKHHILMWYCKNLQIRELSQMNEPQFSEVAKDIIRLLVIQHCRMHKIDYTDRSKITNLLNVKRQALLPRSIK